MVGSVPRFLYTVYQSQIDPIFYKIFEDKWKQWQISQDTKVQYNELSV